MKKKTYILNDNIDIPAIIWGKPSNKIMIAVHGNMSNKEDRIIKMLVNSALTKAYQVVSFDLPKHGERITDEYTCSPYNCISDFHAVYKFAESLGSEISLFACSIGAYFSLLAYYKHNIKQCLFLSPVVNMEKIIKNMMQEFNISEEMLKIQKQIELPISETLNWDYYTFVRENPITFDWNIPTSILYGANDTISNWVDISEFITRYQVKVIVDDKSDHYFHTEEQLEIFDRWLKDVLHC